MSNTENANSRIIEGRLDDAWWGIAEQSAAARRARSTAHSLAIETYETTNASSVKEDYHKAFADLYGMAPVAAGWSNGYTNEAKLSFALNRVVNLAEGKTQVHRRLVDIEFEDVTFEVTKSVPVKTVDQCLIAISYALTGYPGALSLTPPWRIRDGKVDVLSVQTKARATQHKVVETVIDSPPVWHNPYQVEDGFLILPDSPHRNFKRPGVSGLSVLQDSDDRFHLVYWITESFPHKRLNRNGDSYMSTQVAKQPQNCQSFDVMTTEEEAIEQMHKVAHAMESTVRDGHDLQLLPDMAAEFQDVHADESVPMITGSHDWLTAVSDQRATNTTYRPHGAESDD